MVSFGSYYGEMLSCWLNAAALWLMRIVEKLRWKTQSWSRTSNLQYQFTSFSLLKTLWKQICHKMDKPQNTRFLLWLGSLKIFGLNFLPNLSPHQKCFGLSLFLHEKKCI